MVTYTELVLASSELSDIPRMIELCQNTANALMETNGCYIRKGKILAYLFPTDYNRARYQIIAKCNSTIHKLMKVRKSTVSPEAIRAISHVTQIRNLCIGCEKANRNLLYRRKFCCQIQEKFQKTHETGFRFELDKEGRIIEKI